LSEEVYIPLLQLNIRIIPAKAGAGVTICLNSHMEEQFARESRSCQNDLYRSLRRPVHRAKEVDMSDKRNDADEKADAMRKPMADPKVDVKVKPVSRDLPKKRHPDRKRAEEDNAVTNPNTAKKVKENVTKKVKDAIKKAGENPGATRKEQFKAAEKAANDEAGSIPRQRVKEFTVTVGDKYSENTTTHVPKDGGPPPDESSDD